MARQRHTPKGRLLMTGTILLILLVAGVLVTGRIINGMAVQMSERVITQTASITTRLLQAEFGRSEKVLAVAAQFIRTPPQLRRPNCMYWLRR